MTSAPGAAVPRWGTHGRDLKARQIVATVAWFGGGEAALAGTTWCDLGCGNGVIAASIAPRVGRIIGVDPEAWPDWRELAAANANLEFRNEPAEAVSLPPASVDVVVCNQVYEHAADPRALIETIRRILRPGGWCYFAGPNLLFPVEPHVFWPFVHWLPRAWVDRLFAWLGRSDRVDARSRDYWTLRRWLSGFQVENAVPFVVRNPRQVGRDGVLARLASYIPEFALRLATPLSPGFVFILRKPA